MIRNVGTKKVSSSITGSLGIIFLQGPPNLILSLALGYAHTLEEVSVNGLWYKFKNSVNGLRVELSSYAKLYYVLS